MKNFNRNIHITLFLLTVVTSTTYAQYIEDTERKWALSYKGSPWLRPVLTGNTSGKTFGRAFDTFSVMGEYYLPKKWSAEVGYFQANVDYRGHSRKMEGLQLGGKKRFVNSDFFIQPYVMAAAQFNWSDHYEKFEFADGSYQYTRNPRLSFVSGVGAEFYLLSSIAFVVGYNFNIGLDSKTVIDEKPINYEKPYILKDRGMYHNLELGVKITFPFKLTEEDGYALLDLFLYSWF